MVSMVENKKIDLRTISLKEQKDQKDLIAKLKLDFQKKSGNIILYDTDIQGDNSIIFEGKQNEKKFCVKSIIYNYKKTGNAEKDKIKENRLKEIASNEVLLTYNIRYKYCIKMYGYYTFPNATCLILEYALGRDLDKLTNNFYEKKLFICNNRLYDKNEYPIYKKHWINFMSEDLIRYFIYKIASSLAYLKTLNLIHLDLSLNNIFLTKNFNIKLGDFGGSKLIKPGDQFKYEARPSSLKVFVPPECLTNKSISNDDAYKIDIYSMGIIMFKLLTNEYPLNEEMLIVKDEKGNINQEAVQIIKEKLNVENIKRYVEKERGGISNELINLLADSMNYEEKQRIDIYRFLNNKWLKKDFEKIEDIHEKYENDGESKITALQKSEKLNLDIDLDEVDSIIPIKMINEEESDPDFISKQFGALYDYLNNGFLFV